MNNYKKICVVRTDRLGDMVLTLPMCKVLKENYPDSEVTMITRRYVEPLLYNCPVIDKVIYLDDFKKGIKDIFRFNKFDIAFFPRPRLNECFAAYRYKISLRVGTAYRYYSILFNHNVYDHRKSAEYHEAEYNTRLVSSVLKKEVKTELVKPIINNDSKEFVSSLLNKKGINDSNYIILHPGSGGSAYNWKPENFGKVGKIISRELDLKIVVTGVNSESELCNSVMNQCPDVINLCGELDLSRMIALISGAQLLIANSTGILHIAAALGIPVIGLYPNTAQISAKRWGPYSQKSRVVCPDYKNQKDIDNMDLISVEEVVKNSMELIRRS